MLRIIRICISITGMYRPEPAYMEPPVATAADKARVAMEGSQLARQCQIVDYAKSFEGDPVSVFQNAASEISTLVPMQTVRYDALIADLQERIETFSGAMTSGYVALDISYQNGDEDISETIKDGETRQYWAFTVDGDLLDTGIQGNRSLELTMTGGSARKFDDVEFFMKAAQGRRQVRFSLLAKAAKDEVTADTSLGMSVVSDMTGITSEAQQADTVAETKIDAVAMGAAEDATITAAENIIQIDVPEVAEITQIAENPGLEIVDIADIVVADEISVTDLAAGVETVILADGTTIEAPEVALPAEALEKIVPEASAETVVVETVTQDITAAEIATVDATAIAPQPVDVTPLTAETPLAEITALETVTLSESAPAQPNVADVSNTTVERGAQVESPTTSVPEAIAPAAVIEGVAPPAQDIVAPKTAVAIDIETPAVVTPQTMAVEQPVTTARAFAAEAPTAPTILETPVIAAAKSEIAHIETAPVAPKALEMSAPQIVTAEIITPAAPQMTVENRAPMITQTVPAEPVAAIVQPQVVENAAPVMAQPVAAPAVIANDTSAAPVVVEVPIATQTVVAPGAPAIQSPVVTQTAATTDAHAVETLSTPQTAATAEITPDKITTPNVQGDDITKDVVTPTIKDVAPRSEDVASVQIKQEFTAAADTPKNDPQSNVVKLAPDVFTKAEAAKDEIKQSLREQPKEIISTPKDLPKPANDPNPVLVNPEPKKPETLQPPPPPSPPTQETQSGCGECKGERGCCKIFNFMSDKELAEAAERAKVQKTEPAPKKSVAPRVLGMR